MYIRIYVYVCVRVHTNVIILTAEKDSIKVLRISVPEGNVVKDEVPPFQGCIELSLFVHVALVTDQGWHCIVCIDRKCDSVSNSVVFHCPFQW